MLWYVTAAPGAATLLMESAGAVTSNGAKNRSCRAVLLPVQLFKLPMNASNSALWLKEIQRCARMTLVL